MFQFRSAIWSDPDTRPLADPGFLKLTHVHTLLEVVKIVVNWWDPCFIHLRSPEQFEKNAVFVREGYELSITIDKNVKNKWNWKWIQEVDADRVPFRHWCRKFDKPRVATKNYQLKKQNNEKEKGTGLGGGHQILLQETSYKLIPIDRGLLQPESENHRQRIKSNDLEYS